MPRHLNETQTIRPTTEITDLFRQAAGRAHRFQASIERWGRGYRRQGPASGGAEAAGREG
jgi:hypothetical protein